MAQNDEHDPRGWGNFCRCGGWYYVLTREVEIGKKVRYSDRTCSELHECKEVEDMTTRQEVPA